MINVNKIEYYRGYVAPGEQPMWPVWHKLNRTGKIKTTTGPRGNRTYIQHRAWFGAKCWIQCDRIAVLPETTTTITDSKS